MELQTVEIKQEERVRSPFIQCKIICLNLCENCEKLSYFAFPFLVVQWLFRKANGVKNSFTLLLELGVPFPFILKALFLLNLLPMYVSLSVFVSPSNSHDLEKFFPYTGWLKWSFLLFRELWKWQPWCGIFLDWLELILYDLSPAMLIRFSSFCS